MTTTQIPRGANLELFVKKQSSFKSPATGNYVRALAYTCPLVEEKPDEDDPLLGLTKNNTRDMTEPAPGLSTGLRGNIVIPLDFSHLRYWLELVFGAPATSGTTPDFTHTFLSGAVALPAFTIERKFAKASGSIFLQGIGVMANAMTVQVSRQAGHQRISLDCTGYGEDKLAASGAGTPGALVDRDPFAAALGVYKMDSVQLGRIVEVNLTYSNNLQVRDEIGDARPGGYDIGDSALTGSLRVRFTDTTLYDMAVAGTLHAGELLFQKSAARLLSLAAPKVKLQRAGVPVEGPGFIDQSFDLRAHQDASNPMLTVTLKGAQETGA